MIPDTIPAVPYVMIGCYEGEFVVESIISDVQHAALDAERRAMYVHMHRSAIHAYQAAVSAYEAFQFLLRKLDEIRRLDAERRSG